MLFLRNKACSLNSVRYSTAMPQSMQFENYVMTAATFLVQSYAKMPKQYLN